MEAHHYMEGLGTGDDALAAALTSKDGATRIMARGAAGQWISSFTAWVNAEMQRPKADIGDVIEAIMRLQMQTIASIAAQISHAEEDEILLSAIVRLYQNKFVAHMHKTRQHL